MQNCHLIDLALVVFQEGPLFQSLSLRRVGWKQGGEKLNTTILHPIKASRKPRSDGGPQRDTSCTDLSPGGKWFWLQERESIPEEVKESRFCSKGEVLPQALPEKTGEAADGE